MSCNYPKRPGYREYSATFDSSNPTINEFIHTLQKEVQLELEERVDEIIVYHPIEAKINYVKYLVNEKIKSLGLNNETIHFNKESVGKYN